MSKIAFTKFSGSGNDFIFIDNRNLEHRADEMIGFVQRVCRRGQSVGADGLMFIEPSERADFKWRSSTPMARRRDVRERRALRRALCEGTGHRGGFGVVRDHRGRHRRDDERLEGEAQDDAAFDYRAGIELEVNGRAWRSIT